MNVKFLVTTVAIFACVPAALAKHVEVSQAIAEHEITAAQNAVGATAIFAYSPDCYSNLLIMRTNTLRYSYLRARIQKQKALFFSAFTE